MTNVSIEVGRIGASGKIKLDGVDISTGVSGLILVANVREVTQLYLDILPSISVVEAEVRVRLTPEVEKILEAAGWTPPPLAEFDRHEP